MLTFLSPCHRCSVLRQLGCKDGKNWNSKYVISWYMWHKINNTVLSLPTTRCIRIHCFSPSRQSAVCQFSLKPHIFVSVLLIDSYLDNQQKWNICTIPGEEMRPPRQHFPSDDVVCCCRTPWSAELFFPFLASHCLSCAESTNDPVYRPTRKLNAFYLLCHYNLIYVYWFLMCSLSCLSVDSIWFVLTVMPQT